MALINPEITVIIATYNWSSVLPYSIGSVLKQTFQDFEVLVMGDGCTDDSEAVIRTINDPRIFWHNLSHHHGSQFAPNNEGLQRARGRYIAYLGHDDLWLPHHLEKLKIALDKGAEWTYGLTCVIGPQGAYQRPFPMQADYKAGMWISPSCLMHTAEIGKRVGCWSDYRTVSMLPDSEFCYKLSLASASHRFVPHLLTIKFPAGDRKDVYKTRPSEEQESWFKRLYDRDTDIATLEATLLTELVLHTDQKLRQALSYRQALKLVMHETTKRIFRTFVPIKPLLPGERVNKMRKFKGAS